MNKIKTAIFGMIFLLLLNFVDASYANINPGNLYFKEVLSGGYAEKTITITTKSDDAIFVTPLIGGMIREWISLEPNVSLKLTRNFPLVLKVVIKPPKNISKSKYLGYIILNTINKEVPKISSNQETSFVLDTVVEITDKEIKKLTVEYIFVESSEQEHPVDFFIKMHNKGNIKLNPVIELTLEGPSATKKVELLPSEEKETVISLDPNDLKLGEHSANINIFLDDQLIKKETSFFNILKKDSLIRKGIFLGITNKERVHINNRVKIDSYFKNIGEISVYAKFKGNIYFNDVLIEEIDSEQVYVPVGKTVILSSYFIPNEVGLYKITGRLFYAGTTTDEKNSSVNVKPISESLEFIPLEINKAIIVFLIITFLIVTNIYLRKKISNKK